MSGSPKRALNAVSDIELATPEGALTLLQLRGIGPQAVSRLTKSFRLLGDAFGARDGALDGCASGQGRASLRDGRAVQAAFDRAREQLDSASALGIQALTPQNVLYPEWLRLLEDRPAVLYMKGTLRQGWRYVASIGTRAPSEFGITATTRIARALAEQQWSIVSGLALGIDTLAHRAALDAQGHTVAVLANGLDSVYPKSNSRLAAEILESGGALLSEQPLGTPAIARNLVQRDRLQSGMSAGTVVNQTDVKGGSMHTVRFTLMQGRKLFAPVPTGTHAKNEKSQGLLALTLQPARKMVALLELEEHEPYAVLLREMGESSAAVPLRSREDYPRMLEELAARDASARLGAPGQLGLTLAAAAHG